MRRTVLRYGLAAGAATSAFMVATTPIVRAGRLEMAELVGYSSYVALALLVFLGVRSHRQTVGQGRISFRRGFLVGLGITLVSCACYVAVWELLYYKLSPGLGEAYAEAMVESARSSGATPAEIAEMEGRIQSAASMYENPWINAGLTLLEQLPVGLLLTTLAAAILRRR